MESKEGFFGASLVLVNNEELDEPVNTGRCTTGNILVATPVVVSLEELDAIVVVPAGIEELIVVEVEAVGIVKNCNLF